MKYKATKKFENLGIENSYQQIGERNFRLLKSKKLVEIDNPPEFLIKEKYIEIVKGVKNGN